MKKIKLVFIENISYFSDDFNEKYKNVIDAMIKDISGILLYHIKMNSIFNDYLKATDRVLFMSDKSEPFNESYDNFINNSIETVTSNNIDVKNKYNLIFLMIQQSLENLTSVVEDNLAKTFDSNQFYSEDNIIEYLDFEIINTNNTMSFVDRYDFLINDIDSLYDFLYNPENEFIINTNDGRKINSKNQEEYAQILNKKIPELFDTYSKLKIKLSD